MQHMMTARNGTLYDTKCGRTIDSRKGGGHTFTGWWHRVTCAECADRMNLTPAERARLNIRHADG